MSLNERPKLGVGCIVTSTDPETGQQLVLMGVRKGAHGAGTLSFPGGKPDGGESPADAAVRELYEETNLRATHARAAGYWSYDVFPEDDLHYVTLYFFLEVGDDIESLKTMEPDKCEGWQWFDPYAHPLDDFAFPRDAVFFTGVDQALAVLV